jgi:hypothetical protein
LATTRAISARSMKIDPAKVNRKNFIAAWRRLAEPHSPMMKNIGMSVASQNT